MKNKNTKSSEQRRKALKKILAGSGAAGVVAAAPEKWVKPVINSVTLPVHAQTSQPLSFSDPNWNGSLSPDFLETLVPSAHAGVGLGQGILCIKFNQDLQTYQATLDVIDDGQIILELESGTVEMVEDLNYACGDDTATTIELGPYNAGGVSYSVCQGQDCVNGTAFPMDCQLATCDD